MRRRRSRSRPRRAGGDRRGPLYALVVIALATLVAMPAGSVSVADLPRSADANAVTDVDGALALDVASNVTKNKVDPLVNVTNNFGRDVTVTVALQNGNDGDLYLNGTNVGDTATFTLAAGTTKTVEIEATATVGTDVTFDVNASATGLYVDAPGRNTTVESSGGGGGGCSGNNPNC